MLFCNTGVPYILSITLFFFFLILSVLFQKEQCRRGTQRKWAGGPAWGWAFLLISSRTFLSHQWDTTDLSVCAPNLFVLCTIIEANVLDLVFFCPLLESQELFSWLKCFLLWLLGQERKFWIINDCWKRKKYIFEMSEHILTYLLHDE